MKSLRANLPMILLILFELAVGVLLLVEPLEFTRGVIICFGIILLAIGALYLVRFIIDKRREDRGAPAFETEGGELIPVSAESPDGETYRASRLTLFLSIVSIVLGFVCVFATDAIIGVFTVIASLYGLVLILSGVFKIKTYVDLRRAELPVPIVLIVSAVLSVVLGIVIIVISFFRTDYIFMLAGISLIVEAAIDFISVVLSMPHHK